MGWILLNISWPAVSQISIKSSLPFSNLYLYLYIIKAWVELVISSLYLEKLIINLSYFLTNYQVKIFPGSWIFYDFYFTLIFPLLNHQVKLTLNRFFVWKTLRRLIPFFDAFSFFNFKFNLKLFYLFFWILFYLIIKLKKQKKWNWILVFNIFIYLDFFK